MNHRSTGPGLRDTSHITLTGQGAHNVTEIPDQASEEAGGKCQREEEDPAA